MRKLDKVAKFAAIPGLYTRGRIVTEIWRCFGVAKQVGAGWRVNLITTSTLLLPVPFPHRRTSVSVRRRAYLAKNPRERCARGYEVRTMAYNYYVIMLYKKTLSSGGVK